MKQSTYKLTLLKIGYLVILVLGFGFNFFYAGGLEGFKKGLKDGEGNESNLTELPYVKLEPLKKDSIKLASANNTDSIFFGTTYSTTAYIQGKNFSNKLIIYDLLENLLATAIAVLYLLLFVNIYKFIGAISSKEVFTLKNINRLSSMGWICITMAPLYLLYTYLSYRKKALAFESLPYKVIPEFDFDFTSIIFGITLLTIAYAFKKGLQLQQENDLTI